MVAPAAKYQILAARQVTMGARQSVCAEVRAGSLDLEAENSAARGSGLGILGSSAHPGGRETLDAYSAGTLHLLVFAPSG